MTDLPQLLPLRVSLKAAQHQDTPLASGTLQIYMGMMTTFFWLAAVKHRKEGVSYSSYCLLDANPGTWGKGVPSLVTFLVVSPWWLKENILSSLVF